MTIFILIFAAVIAFFTLIVTDMIMYGPGEKRRLNQERRARVHTKSHYYKATRK
jgi:hypothetical protein